jgi:nicotinate-nucleotide--dimethylbenzimidazole phosphoribosyltransferase
VRAGSGRIDREDALTVSEASHAVQVGRDAADRAVDAGADLLVAAVCGVGVSTPTATLVSVVTGAEPVDVTTRGSGIDDAAWMRKVAAVRDARRRVPVDSDVLTMLQTAGGADLAALTGFLAQAALRRTPVLLHDVPSTLAAVLAHRVCVGADRWFLAVSAAPERTAPRLLELLDCPALVDWELTGATGLPALLLLPVLRAAASALDAAPEQPPARSAAAIDTWNPDLL